VSGSVRFARVYGPAHWVTRYIIRAEPAIVTAVRRTEERLRGFSADVRYWGIFSLFLAQWLLTKGQDDLRNLP
jgi:hypothetical protein